MEVPSIEFYMKVGVAIAALKELQSDKNYLALGETSNRCPGLILAISL